MITMIDSIEGPATTGNPIPSAILNAAAVGAYVYGNSWPTYREYAAARPDLDRAGRIVTITLEVAGLPRGIARCADYEKGGMVIADFVPFMGLADRRYGLPWHYCAASNGAALLQYAADHSYYRGRDFFYWSAHYTGEPHVCAPNVCGYPEADGTQYTDQIAGNCDGSLLNDYMLHAPETINIPEDEQMLSSCVDHKGNIHVFVEVPDSKDDPTAGAKVYEVFQTDGTHWAGGEPNKRKAAAYPLVRVPQDVA